MSKYQTMIGIKLPLKQRLDSLKEYPKESYGDIIEKLIKFYEIYTGTRVLAKQSLPTQEPSIIQEPTKVPLLQTESLDESPEQIDSEVDKIIQDAIKPVRKLNVPTTYGKCVGCGEEYMGQYEEIDSNTARCKGCGQIIKFEYKDG